MSTQQWEIGDGSVWTFEATSIVTSGDVVKFDGDRVKVAQATGDRPVGVCLFPASAGKYAAVALDLIVYVNLTGVAPTGGAYVVAATQGKARTFAGVPAAGDWENILGRAIEAGTANARAKVKLIW